jgi:hypothetical protein
VSIIARFYDAFARRDWEAMGACYHPEARFSDPVFLELDAAQVKAMWRMLLTSDSDLRITYQVVQEDAVHGQALWDAWYTFSRTGRKVHNRITARFIYKDGLILRHEDRFDLWRWSRQALGTSGVLLGWSPVVRNKVRRTAAEALHRSMQAHGAR